MGMFGSIMSGLRGDFMPQQPQNTTPTDIGVRQKPSLADIAMLVGAGLKDVGNQGESNNLVGVMQWQDERRKRLQQEQAMAQLRGLFGGQAAQHLPTMQEAAPALLAAQMAGVDGAGDMASIIKAGQPEERRAIEGPNGIYEEQGDGSWKMTTPYPDKPNTSPWIMNPDGSMTPRKGGPYDPAYIGKTTGVRRDAVVSRPMPRAPGRAKAGGSQLPPGYIPR